MFNHRLRNNNDLDLLEGRFGHCSWSTFIGSHYKNGRITTLMKYANQYHPQSRKNRHLGDRYNPIEYYSEDFRIRFRFSKDSVADLVKILEQDLTRQTRRGLPLTPMNAASPHCSEIFCDKVFRANDQRFIWRVCVFCVHLHSQGVETNENRAIETFKILEVSQSLRLCNETL